MNQAAAIPLYAKELKIPTFADYPAVIRQARDQGWGYEEFLAAMLAREAASRKERQIARRVKLARLPFQKTLEEFKLEALPHVQEALVWELAAGEFIKRRENIVMIGNPGTGKTHLSIALGLKACVHGYSVRFLPPPAWLPNWLKPRTKKAGPYAQRTRPG